MSVNAETLSQIINLAVKNTVALDYGNVELWTSSFVEDGHFVLLQSDIERRWSGYNELREFAINVAADVSHKDTVRRWINSPVVSVSGDKATLRAMLLVMTRGSGPVIASSGWHEDILIKKSGVWRFQERKVVMDKGAYAKDHLHNTFKQAHLQLRRSATETQ